MANPNLPIHDQAPQDRTPNQDSTRTQCQRLQDIGATPYTAIKIHLAAARYSLHYFRQCLDGRRNAIKLATTMIRDHDTSNPMLYRQLRILSRQNPLQNNG